MGWLKKALKFVVNPLGAYGVAREATKVLAKKYPKVALAAAPVAGIVPVLGTTLAEVGTRKAYEELARRDASAAQAAAVSVPESATETTTPAPLPDLPVPSLPGSLQIPILSRTSSLRGSYESGLPLMGRSMSRAVRPSSPYRRRKSSKKKMGMKAKRRSGRKLKFGSPAWRKKYMKKSKRGKRK